MALEADINRFMRLTPNQIYGYRPRPGSVAAIRRANAFRAQRRLRRVPRYFYPSSSVRGSTRNVELKYYDNPQTGATMDSVGQVLDISGVTQGSAVTQRNGNYITLKSIALRGLCSLGSGAVTDQCRVILFYDKFNTGFLPTVSNVISSGGASTAVSLMNMNYSDRFVVLRDWYFELNTQSGIATKQLKLFKRMNMPIKFSAGSDKNHICMLVIGNNTGAAASQITFSFRMRFCDT